MRGRLLYVLLALIFSIVSSGFNSNRILHCTQQINQLAMVLNAETQRNIELKIERDDLQSGKHISYLIARGEIEFTNKEKAPNIIYVKEEREQKQPTYYAIIDLLTPKAEATTTVQPD